jgi:hypothetical protein
VLLRLLIFCLAVFALLLVVRTLFSLRQNRSRQFGRSSSSAAEEMVLDPECHSYLPKEEAIFEGGRYFCSRECAKRYLAR